MSPSVGCIGAKDHNSGESRDGAIVLTTCAGSASAFASMRHLDRHAKIDSKFERACSHRLEADTHYVT